MIFIFCSLVVSVQKNKYDKVNFVLGYLENARFWIYVVFGVLASLCAPDMTSII